ncbi:hypothetical protein MPTK1_5g20090 [Marchantia polymorpha subsp. ruderalis]|uniref:F-box domain-containing protein n=2 Tax=Marchantia polymorpha TaxID=3197 RepID=A0AAF6BKA7_MARPO|nr:hypothetical protein Mp_5g20090 [Marchantia polymorpha subsp. ruderalis]
MSIMLCDLLPELWSTLPHHLTEEVLRKLPFRILIKMRLVCKEWNNFILNGGLPPNPCTRNLLMSVAEDSAFLTSYNKEVKKWQQLSLSFVDVDLSAFTLVVSDGGLLCFQCDKSSDEFVVCNPLSQKWKRLPRVSVSSAPPESLSWDVAGLMVEKNGMSYKLIVIGRFKHEEENGSLETVMSIYESSTDAWVDADSQHMIARGSLISIRGKAVSSRGSLYTMARQKGDHFVDDWYLLKYDVQLKTWSRLAAPLGIGQPDVFEHQGQIYLVAQCWEAILGPELCVWKLDKAGQVWSKSKSIFRDLCVVFTRMPDHWSDKSRLLGDDTSVCICIGQERSVFAVGMESSGTIAVWAYDLKTECWSSLPPVSSDDFVPQVACAFQPSLSARV